MNPPRTGEQRISIDDRYRSKEKCYEMMAEQKGDYRKFLLWLLGVMITLYVGSLALFDDKLETTYDKTEQLLEKASEARVRIYQRVGDHEVKAAQQEEQLKSVRQTQERTFQMLGKIETKLESIEKEVRSK